MEAVDKVGKIVKFILAAGSCSNYVIDVTHVKVGFGSRTLLKNLFLNVTDEKQSVVWSELTSYSDTARLVIETAVEGKAFEGKDQFSKAH